jgi:hypothetical protein
MARVTDNLLDKAISKYGGEDMQYQNELKRQIRDYLGYSKWKKTLDKIRKRKIEVDYPEGPIMPSAVIGGAQSAFNIKSTKEKAYESLVSGADTAADQTASGLIAEQKRKAAEARAASAEARARARMLPTQLVEGSRDWVDSEIRNYLLNPLDDNGRIIPISEMKNRLKEQWIGEGQISEYVQNESDIDARVSQFIPEDFEANWRKYVYGYMGFSESEAESLTAYQRFSSGEMGTLEKESFKIMNSSLAERAEMISNTRGIEELMPQRDPRTGEMKVPQLPTFDELVQKYSSVPETELKQIATPSYRISLQDDFKTFMTENPDMRTLMNSVTMGESSFNSVLANPSLSDYLDELHMTYRGVFPSREAIKAELYDYILSGKFSTDFYK